jgi:CHAT domain-containing protein
LLATIHEKERELDAAEDGRRTSLASELEGLRNDFAVKRLERKLDAADQNDLTRVAAVSLGELQGKILDPATTLLVYGAGLDDLSVWVVDRDSIQMATLSLSEEEQHTIADQAHRFRGRPATVLAQRGSRPLHDGSDLSAEALYDKLIAPVAEFLRHRRLIIIPHGLLHHLPFAALRNPATGRYLVEDFTLSLAPSVSALRLLASSEDGSDVHGSQAALVLGDPVTHLGALDGARREAEALGRLFDLEPLLAEQATEAAVHAGAAQVGLLNRTRLVTLSDCEAALGEATRGDEVIGLTQAFLVAGSRAVVSTLWPVHDEASERLMVVFYSRLQGGTLAAEALRAAQIELLSDADYRDPYFWAGYTLTGDPRTRWSRLAQS